MSWPSVKLGECVEIVSGATPSTSVKENWDGDILWATPKDLSGLNNKNISATDRCITEKGLNSCSARILPKNSVLFSSRAPIGLVAINTVPMATNQGFKSFIPKPNILSEQYLYYWLKNNREDINRMGVGATFKEVSKTIVSKIIIPLPPLTEQQRIAEILDKVELVKRKRELAIEKLDSLAQSIYRRNFGNSPSIKLEEICSFQNGGTPSKEISEYWAGDIAWISSADIVGSKIQYGRNFITALGVDNSATNIAPKGTILIVTRTGVGKVAVTDRPTAFSQDIVSITLKKGFDINFVCEALKNNLPYFLSHARGATIQGITRNVLASALIPNIDEGSQNIFGKIMSAINEKNHLFIKSLGDIESLGASLESQAFSGQL